jgi:hypothetical protein
LGELRVLGVIFPEDAPLAGKGVLVKFPGLLVFTQCAEVGGEVVGSDEGVEVVVAEDAAAAGEGVLVECAGPLVFAQLAEVEGEIAGRGEGVGVVMTEALQAFAVGATQYG